MSAMHRFRHLPSTTAMPPPRSWPVLLLVFLVLTVASSATAAALHFVDQDGTEHHLPGACSRIISLYPAHTENLAEIGAADTLLGISTSDTGPETILDKPRFSYHDTAEKFIAAAPDCLLIRPMIRHSTPNLLDQLTQFGITVISLQPSTPDELYTYWRILGELSGHPDGAERMIERFDRELGILRRQVAVIPQEERPHVYFQAIHRRMRTFSPTSIAMFCLLEAGGVNVADDALPRRNTNIADYSKERILAKAEQIDVFLAQSGRMNRITIEEIQAEPGFGAIKAVRTGRIHLVDEDLVARPTSRLLDGIRRIHRLLYESNL